jgi:hypothetical protein
MASVRTAWRLKPLLEPGERLVWVDRPADRAALWLLAFVVAVGAGAMIVALSPDRLVALAAVAAGVGILALAFASRPPARATYAASDQGRAFVVEAERTLVFPLPEQIEVRATDPLHGELDLGTVEARVYPANRPERLTVRLQAIANPQEVATRLRSRPLATTG